VANLNRGHGSLAMCAKSSHELAAAADCRGAEPPDISDSPGSLSTGAWQAQSSPGPGPPQGSRHAGPTLPRSNISKMDLPRIEEISFRLGNMIQCPAWLIFFMLQVQGGKRAAHIHAELCKNALAHHEYVTFCSFLNTRM
jgi:hypothetical protein